MNGKVELNISKEDLAYELQEFVKELAESEIKEMIKTQATEMVRAEIDKILHPLVLRTLTEESFDFNSGYYNYTNKQKLDDKLKRIVIDYLNRPSYLYSRDKRTPSERYSASSSGGDNTPLINHIVEDEIRLFVDKEFTPKIKSMVESLITDKIKLEETLKEQTRRMVLEKIK